ncbi:uncharacterized protein CCOS01_09598 [Colletotrichum costaricense]|uniref:Uncharacterized protein n=1 Tax=Colletotrichum costaricense TaxID=1209916 RepID=A0AAI9YUW8_9PEZI|nr:uncharacterized protein CCOS01_09598 [Colletotrichum costaricense]KAK1524511.1 hypothetical protein CCOS01_09598 [Colletotrichum costaricense]
MSSENDKDCLIPLPTRHLERLLIGVHSSNKRTMLKEAKIKLQVKSMAAAPGSPWWLPAETSSGLICDILPTIGGGGTVKRHDKPRINLAAMRNVSLVSTDLRFATLTDPSRRMARATMDAAGARKLQSLGGASLSTHAKH